MAQKVLPDRALEPLLMLPDGRGMHYAEHIPPESSKWYSEFQTTYVVVRSRLGLAIYYWQLRHLFPPKDRKIYDLNFIRHVENDHDGKPELWLEKFHYFIAKRLYGFELSVVRYFETSPWRKEHVNDIYFQRDAYIKAYKKKWVDSFNEHPEWRTLFHGVSILDVGIVMDRIAELKTYRQKLVKRLKLNQPEPQAEENK